MEYELFHDRYKVSLSKTEKLIHSAALCRILDGTSAGDMSSDLKRYLFFEFIENKQYQAGADD